MDNKTKVMLKRYSWAWYSLFAVIGVILIGIYYFTYPEPSLITSEDGKTVVQYINHSLGYILLKELGIAILIAVALIMTIESFSHKKKELDQEEKEQRETAFLEHCTTNVLESVYKRYIPESTFTEVERCLLRGKCSRKEYLIDYTIRDFTESEATAFVNNHTDEHFMVNVYSSYKLVNMLDEEITTDVYFGLEVPNEKQYSDVTEISSFKVKKEERIVNPQKVSSHGECHFKTKVTLKPLESVDIEMSGVTVKRKIDSEVWASRLPSDGIRVIVRAPNSLELHCKANNSHMIERVSENFWELKHGIFPHQSIVLWWNGKAGS